MFTKQSLQKTTHSTFKGHTPACCQASRGTSTPLAWCQETSLTHTAETILLLSSGERACHWNAESVMK